MRTASQRLEDLAAAVARAAPDLGEEQQRIAIALYRRLAEGSPAPIEQVADRAGANVARVRILLDTWPGVYRDEGGRVVGFGGLTIRRVSPTHRFEVNGRGLYTWCAWDALFLPEILDATAKVESACPTTDAVVSLVVSPERIVRASHPDAVVSFLLDRDFDADVIQSFCHFIYFFSSGDGGSSWTARHPGTFLLSLDEAFELGRRVNALTYPAALGSGR